MSSHRIVLIVSDFDHGIAPQLVSAIAAMPLDATLVVLAGWGATEAYNPVLSLHHFAAQLTEAIGREVSFLPESVGAEARIALLAPNRIALLENVRFHHEHRSNPRILALRLMSLGDAALFVGEPAPSDAGWRAALADILPDFRHAPLLEEI